MTAVAMVLIAMLSTACSSTQNVSPTPNSGNFDGTTVSGTAISQSKAKQIALLDSGVLESETKFMRVDLKNDNSAYDVKFWGNSKAYEYVIDANTGDIESFRHDAAVLAAVADGATMLDEAAAKKAALGYVNFSEADVVFGDVELDDKSSDTNDRTKWKLEFLKNNLQYKFDVDAYTGEIISYEYENLQHTGTNTSIPISSGLVGEATAKASVLRDAGLNEADATIMKLVLNNKSQNPVYDVEFHSGNLAYAYKVDARSGDIVSYSSAIMTQQTTNNAGGTTQDNTNSSGLIGEAKAKQIALQHAGLAESNVTYVYGKLVQDDGAYRYKIGFYSNAIEYEYEIDAKTGNIISFDKDIDNFYIPGDNVNSNITIKITAQKAKEIALADAGLTESQVIMVRQPYLEYDNGRMEYEVEFYKANTEYDYTIDANTGKIISKDFDIENYDIKGIKPGDTTTKITAQKAKEIALADAGLTESQVLIVRQPHLDFDDGRWEYEIEFYKDNVEYDYTIDANTGMIVSKDYDAEYYTPQVSGGSANQGAKITAEQALQKALNRAGVSASNALVTKSKLDFDDGRWEYEIEFRVGRVEYEVTVDATTGNIIKFESDFDD